MYGKLSRPRTITGQNVIEQLDGLKDNFYEIFMSKSSRDHYKNKFIFFNMSKNYNEEVLDYPERFLHICSLENKSQYNIFPCNNDQAFFLCKTQCKLHSAHEQFHKLNRIECLYRMSRIHWIPEIIALANAGDEGIKTWTKLERNKNADMISKHYIRYQEELVDYVVILKEDIRSGKLYKYDFISAFPVFTKRNKEQYSRDYSEYLSQHVQV